MPKYRVKVDEKMWWDGMYYAHAIDEDGNEMFCMNSDSPEKARDRVWNKLKENGTI